MRLIASVQAYFATLLLASIVALGQSADLPALDIPRSGRVLLAYEVIDDGMYGQEILGVDFHSREFVRIHAGTAYGTTSSGRQFAGTLAGGVDWTEDIVRMENAAALMTAPMELLRLLADRPDLIESTTANPDGGVRLEMTVLGSLPGGSQADFPDGAIVSPEQWLLDLAPDGRLQSVTAPISRRYTYAEDPWPVAIEVISPTTTIHWELKRVEDLASDAVTPAGALRLLREFAPLRVRGPLDESAAAAGKGPVPEEFERDSVHRWSFALILGGVLILLLGGGVLIRKRYGGA